jgi:hypothetical protein
MAACICDTLITSKPDKAFKGFEQEKGQMERQVIKFSFEKLYFMNDPEFPQTTEREHVR